MTTATTGYTIVEENDRIRAEDGQGIEICGAYQPVGHNYWSLYVTRLVTNLIGVQVPPHREHFYGQTGRSVARGWITMIAALYVRAVQRESSSQ